MTFDRKQANITGPLVRSLSCSSSENLMKKAQHEIMVNSQGQLDRFSCFVSSLATPQKHIITSPDT